MRAIIGASLRFRLLVVGIAAGVMVLGITQLRNAPVDVLPEFTPPYVEVQTEALGLSAEEVEQLVTVPLGGRPPQRDARASACCARSRSTGCRRSRCCSSPAPTSWMHVSSCRSS